MLTLQALSFCQGSQVPRKSWVGWGGDREALDHQGQKNGRNQQERLSCAQPCRELPELLDLSWSVQSSTRPGRISTFLLSHASRSQPPAESLLTLGPVIEQSFSFSFWNVLIYFNVWRSPRIHSLCLSTKSSIDLGGGKEKVPFALCFHLPPTITVNFMCVLPEFSIKFNLLFKANIFR